MDSIKPPMVHQQSTASEPSPNRLTAERAMSMNRKKRLGDWERSRSVGATPLARRPRSAGEFTSIYQVCSDILGVTGRQRYGNLLSRGTTEDSDYAAGKAQAATEGTKHESAAANTVELVQDQNCVRISLKLPDGEVVSPVSDKEKAKRKMSSPYAHPLLGEKEKAAEKYRIVRRQVLFKKRRVLCVLCMIFAITGLVLMMVEEEITALNAAAKSDWFPITLRVLVLLTTITLLLSVIAHHVIEVQIFLVDSGAEDWQVAMTAKRVLLIIGELAVCAICPLPGTGYFYWPYIATSKPETMGEGGGGWEQRMVRVPVDVLLSVPMFFRCYLICRVMVLHSKQFQDTGTRSIAALNQVTVDFRFVFKTLMAEYPVAVLTVFALSICCCAAWMFTQCERHGILCNYGECHTYLNSLWLVMITFLSIGYGDVVPHTYCGRLVAVSTGIVGAGVSSTLIAVISRKIELSRSEKQVNNFVADSKLIRRVRDAAASVLQETWLIHRYKCRPGLRSSMKVREHQRKFLKAIYRFRTIKWAQRKLKERQFEVVDVGKVQHELQETMSEMQETQEHMVNQIHLLSRNVGELQEQLATLICMTREQQQHHHQHLQQVQVEQPQQQQVSPTMMPKGLSKFRRAPPLTVVASHPSNITVDAPFSFTVSEQSDTAE